MVGNDDGGHTALRYIPDTYDLGRFVIQAIGDKADEAAKKPVPETEFHAERWGFEPQMRF